MLHTVCHLGHVVCDQLQSRNDLTNSSVSRNTTEPSINDNNEAQDILKWTSLFISSKDGTYSNPLSSDIVLFHYGLLPRSTIFFFNFMITRNTYRSHNWIPRPQLIPSIATLMTSWQHRDCDEENSPRLAPFSVDFRRSSYYNYFFTHYFQLFPDSQDNSISIVNDFMWCKARKQRTCDENGAHIE